jgi:hypothetical protein
MLHALNGTPHQPLALHHSPYIPDYSSPHRTLANVKTISKSDNPAITNFPDNILDEDLPTSEHRANTGSPSNFNIHIPYKSLMKDHAHNAMKRVTVSHGIFSTSTNIEKKDGGSKNLSDLLIKIIGRLVEIFGEMKYLLLKVVDVGGERGRLAEEKAQKIRHLL